VNNNKEAGEFIISHFSQQYNPNFMIKLEEEMTELDDGFENKTDAVNSRENVRPIIIYKKILRTQNNIKMVVKSNMITVRKFCTLCM
jgi:hypothetical protein